MGSARLVEASSPLKAKTAFQLPDAIARKKDADVQKLESPPGIASASSLLGDIAVILSSIAVIGSIPGLPVLTLLACRYIWRTTDDESRLCAYFLAGILVLIAGCMFMRPKRSPLKGKLWDWWLEYLSVKVVYQGGEPLPSAQQYIYCMVPHGLYPFAGCCALISSMVDLFPGLRFAVAPIGFSLPVIRYFLYRTGCITPDKRAMTSALQGGFSVGVFPGGIAEMVRTNAERERLVLKGRRGFVRLALEQGVPIVPVYVFGQSMLLSHLQLPQWVERVSRFLRISIIIPYGRFGLLIPRKLPLLYAIGKPIECRSSDCTPTEEEITEVLNKVVSSVNELYDTYKDAYGWMDRPLSIE